MTLSVGVDVGGTKILAGLVDEQGNVLGRWRERTYADDFDQLTTRLGCLVDELSAGADVRAVGVGFAGLVDASRSRVMLAPNLSQRDVPLREALEHRLSRHVVVENDANAAAWGEAQYGATRDTNNSLLVTVGTGVGGGLLLDGRLQRGANGAAAEIGHLTVVPGGLRCPCGKRGCLEQYASGRALVRNVRQLLANRVPGSSTLLDEVDGDIGAVTGNLVSRAAHAGDALARDQLALIGGWLGSALASLVSVLDPETIVIGGGVAEAGSYLLDPAQQALNAALLGRDDRPEIVLRRALLGNDAGFIGAANLASRSVLEEVPQSTFVPYISPRGSAISSSLAPFGSRK
jgi:glucokinase